MPDTPAEIGIRACAACGGSALQPGREVFDDRYGDPDLFHLVECRTCGHMMTAPPLSEADLPALYSTYYPRREQSAAAIKAQAARFNRSLGGLKRWLMGTYNQGQYRAEPGDLVLDVGCGSGLSLLEAKALGAQAFGIETDPNVAPLAQQLGLEVHIGNIFDVPFPTRKFDLVALNQVIEHVADPERTLLAVGERLAEGGMVVAAFPNRQSVWRRLCGDRWLNWHIPFHLNHFTANSFGILAERCGYEVVRRRTVTPNVWTLMQLRVWREVPKRGVPSPAWSTAAAGSRRTPFRRIVGALRVALLLPPVTIVNRIVDALGAGDSLMFELRRAGRP